MVNPSHVVRNDRINSRRERFRYNPNTQMLIRWGCTSQVPCNNVMNTSNAIQQVNNKLLFRETLNDAELCPPTYFESESAHDAVDQGKTLVVRPGHHAQGRNLYSVSTHAELDNAIMRCNRIGAWYASDLIDKVEEYRVFVGSGRVVWVARKVPRNPEAIAWNNATGNGVFENVRWGDWNLKVVRIAIEGYNLSDLHFGGVDVIVDRDNNAYIVEINSAPSQTSPYRQQCCAKYFDYSFENGKERISLINERGGWRKFIHPALNEEAYETNN